uniref:Uncharacterized protein n=1 Tax=Onchocerca volvulus TaxID=6282 RepID=A0A8R1XVT1_ONCVO
MGDKPYKIFKQRSHLKKRKHRHGEKRSLNARCATKDANILADSITQSSEKTSAVTRGPSHVMNATKNSFTERESENNK